MKSRFQHCNLTIFSKSDPNFKLLFKTDMKRYNLCHKHRSLVFFLLYVSMVQTTVIWKERTSDEEK